MNCSQATHPSPPDSTDDPGHLPRLFEPSPSPEGIEPEPELPGHETAPEIAGSRDNARRRVLPTIVVTDRPLHEVTDEAIEALLAANDPPSVFLRGENLVRLRVYERDDRTSFDPLNPDLLRERLSRVAAWKKVRRSSHGVELTDCYPPMDCVRNLLASPSLPFPVIEAVVEAPTFSREGNLVVEPGYHPSSRLYYRHDPGLVVGPVPEQPTPIEVVRARDLLMVELLGDFPFADESSRANALAALLLPFARPMIDGPTPLHLIDAPTQGTGKTLLAQVLGFPALGRVPDSMAEGRDDDEWRKRITAALMQSSAFVLLDNLRRTLDSGALASALTARTWKDRILGTSKMADLPVNCCWLATGNNVVLSREFTRRTALIRLDSRTNRPWLRSGFRQPDILAWADNHREELIQAALILIRAWIAEGRPRGDQTLGMYESWASTMGGILGVAEVPRFLGNLKSLDLSVDRGTAEWEGFLQCWWARHGEQAVGVDKLFEIALREELLTEVLGSESDRSQRIRLGKALASRRDQTIGRLRLERLADDHKGRAVYRLQETP